MPGWNWYVNAEPDDAVAAEASLDTEIVPPADVGSTRPTGDAAEPAVITGTATTRGSAAFAPTDSQLQKLVKLFPIEVVTVYVALDAFARTAPTDAVFDTTVTVRAVVTGLVALAALVSVPQAFSRFRHVRFDTTRGRQMILIGMGAFVAWSYAVGGFFIEVGLYTGWIAGLAIIGYLAAVWLYGPKGLVHGV